MFFRIARSKLWLIVTQGSELLWSNKFMKCFLSYSSLSWVAHGYINIKPVWEACSTAFTQAFCRDGRARRWKHCAAFTCCATTTFSRAVTGAGFGNHLVLTSKVTWFCQVRDTQVPGFVTHHSHLTPKWLHVLTDCLSLINCQENCLVKQRSYAEDADQGELLSRK